MLKEEKYQKIGSQIQLSDMTAGVCLDDEEDCVKWKSRTQVANFKKL